MGDERAAEPLELSQLWGSGPPCGTQAQGTPSPTALWGKLFRDQDVQPPRRAGPPSSLGLLPRGWAQHPPIPSSSLGLRNKASGAAPLARCPCWFEVPPSGLYVGTRGFGGGGDGAWLHVNPSSVLWTLGLITGPREMPPPSWDGPAWHPQIRCQDPGVPPPPQTPALPPGLAYHPDPAPRRDRAGCCTPMTQPHVSASRATLPERGTGGCAPHALGLPVLWPPYCSPVQGSGLCLSLRSPSATTCVLSKRARTRAAQGHPPRVAPSSGVAAAGFPCTPACTHCSVPLCLYGRQGLLGTTICPGRPLPSAPLYC